MNTHNNPHGGGPPTESESLKNAWQQENLKKIREALNIAFIEKKTIKTYKFIQKIIK